MDALLWNTAAVLIPLVLTVGAYLFHFVTVKGAVSAFLFAAFIGLAGGFWWLIAFLALPVAGFAATKVGFSEKKQEGVQEGKKGERSWRNIAGVSLAPAIAAACFYLAPAQYSTALTIGFISALAVSTADTVASEIGVADHRVWMITNFKRTIPGINGGISVVGLLSSLIAALTIAFIDWIFICHHVSALFLIAGLAGMAGNLLDSVVGAAVENKGGISKYGNNFVTAFAGSVLGFAVALLF
ncbi:MAG: DUF92 domain-containing protein [Candidatus Methanomethylophilus sp.]|nr:DUF92 domain-containing protein [Methanomethylophilus sp.]